MGNSSVEGISPLALTYHFGRSGTDITENTLQPPGSNQAGNEEGTEILEASFRDSDTWRRANSPYHGTPRSALVCPQVAPIERPPGDLEVAPGVPW